VTINGHVMKMSNDNGINLRLVLKLEDNGTIGESD
jgi:hypothetical protein